MVTFLQTLTCCACFALLCSWRHHETGALLIPNEWKVQMDPVSFCQSKAELRLRKQNKKNTHLCSMLSGKNSSNAKVMVENVQGPGKRV